MYSRSHMKFVRNYHSWRVEEAFSGIEGCLETIAHRNHYNICEMSLDLGCSHRHLYDVFMRDLGVSPQNWVDGRRMLVARKKLENGSAIREVSVDLGYSSVVAFTRRFGRAYGLPPGRYLRERVNRRSQPV